MSVQQVRPYDYFPSGDYRDLAVIRFDPADLATRYDLTFEEIHDDLDWFKRVAIALPDGSQAWFIKYRGDHDPGTVAVVDAAADLMQAMTLLKQTLGITDDDLLWVTPGADARQVSA